MDSGRSFPRKGGGGGRGGGSARCSPRGGGGFRGRGAPRGAGGGGFSRGGGGGRGGFAGGRGGSGGRGGRGSGGSGASGGRGGERGGRTVRSSEAAEEERKEMSKGFSTNPGGLRIAKLTVAQRKALASGVKPKKQVFHDSDQSETEADPAPHTTNKVNDAAKERKFAQYGYVKEVLKKRTVQKFAEEDEEDEDDSDEYEEVPAHLADSKIGDDGSDGEEDSDGDGDEMGEDSDDELTMKGRRRRRELEGKDPRGEEEGDSEEDEEEESDSDEDGEEELSTKVKMSGQNGKMDTLKRGSVEDEESEDDEEDEDEDSDDEFTMKGRRRRRMLEGKDPRGDEEDDSDEDDEDTDEESPDVEDVMIKTKPAVGIRKAANAKEESEEEGESEDDEEEEGDSEEAEDEDEESADDEEEGESEEDEEEIEDEHEEENEREVEKLRKRPASASSSIPGPSTSKKSKLDEEERTRTQERHPMKVPVGKKVNRINRLPVPHKADDSESDFEETMASQKLKKIVGGGPLKNGGIAAILASRKNLTDASVKVREGKGEFRNQLSDLPLGEVRQMRDDMGVKRFNKVFFGTTFQEREKERERKKTLWDPEFKKCTIKGGPVEETTRKPVSVYRPVYEGANPKRFDPRFDEHCAGEFDEDIFNLNYGFLKEIKEKEVKEVRTALSEAKAEGNDEEADRLALLLRRMTDQEKTQKQKEMRKETYLELKKENMERMKKGWKPIFKRHAEVKMMVNEKKFKTLKKEKGLEKYIARREKKEIRRQATPSHRRFDDDE